MLNVFSLNNGRLVQTPLTEGDPLPEDVIWVDLVAPSPEERSRVMDIYQQPLPTPEELKEIEETARFYKDDDGLHVHSFFFHDFEDTPVNVTVAFTLRDGRLFSLRDEELATFRKFRLQARRQPGLVADAMSILLSLFEAKVERLADVLEQVYTGLEGVGQNVMARNNGNMEVLLSQIAAHEDTNGKARLSLMDTQRALSFMLRNVKLSGDQVDKLREISRDIESLLTHSAFLFDKVNFLMDALMGFVNIEQNQIIKIFSIAAVVFLPPTLVASMYGMNFRVMPELNWPFGYPFAILLMILSGLAPFWYFKRKGWL